MLARQHIDPLTGIRGFASFWVLLHHSVNLYPLGEVELGAVGRLFEKGWLGVDLFFVLSGFVISYVYADKMARPTLAESSRFLKLRVARVYPAHLVTTLAFVPVVVGARLLFDYRSPEETFSLPKLMYSLTLTNGWGFPDSVGWNVPSWSVSSELFAYLCFPLLAPALVRVRGVALNALLAAATLAVMVALAVVLNDRSAFILEWRFALTRIGSEFIIGCLLYNIYRETRHHVAWDVAAFTAFAAIVTLSLLGTHPFYDFVLIAAFAVLVLALSRASGPAARLFGSRPLVYLGEISYSIYLVHTLVLLVMGQVARRLFPAAESVGSATLVAIYALYVALSLLLGHLLFQRIEEPARRWLRGRWIR